MHATIKLVNPEKSVNLLHAFMAIHDRFSHDNDQISFFHDGMALHIHCSVNYVTFGPANENKKDHFWSENVSIGELDRLVMHFFRGEWKELERYPWLRHGGG